MPVAWNANLASVVLLASHPCILTLQLTDAAGGIGERATVLTDKFTLEQVGKIRPAGELSAEQKIDPQCPANHGHIPGNSRNQHKPGKRTGLNFGTHITRLQQKQQQPPQNEKQTPLPGERKPAAFIRLLPVT